MHSSGVKLVLITCSDEAASFNVIDPEGGAFIRHMKPGDIFTITALSSMPKLVIEDPCESS